MNVEDIGEAIIVRADFSGGMATPRVFKRAGRDHRVTAVNARWIDREGRYPTWHFSVQTEDGTCLLSFHTGDLLWRLDQVAVD